VVLCVMVIVAVIVGIIDSICNVLIMGVLIKVSG